MNMSIYQIDRAMMELIDEETGEIKDFEAFEQLALDRDTKIENTACWIKNLEADAKKVKEESEKLAERAKSYMNQAERLKRLLVYALNGEKFDSVRCAVRWRSSESIEIEDETKIPKKYLAKKITYAPDKNAIKEMFKAGKNVKGCKLIKKLNAQIK